MKTIVRLLAAALVAAALAGCIEDTRESRDTDDADARQERRIVVDLPEDALRLEVDVTASAGDADADVTVLIEDASGANLADSTFSVSGQETHRLEANVQGHDRVTIVVTVVDGDATLDVEARAVVPGEPAVVIVRETVVIQVESPPPTTTTAPTPTTQPTPTSPPPTTTTPPPTEPTPPPTNDTNETNQTV